MGFNRNIQVEGVSDFLAVVYFLPDIIPDFGLLLPFVKGWTSPSGLHLKSSPSGLQKFTTP